MTSAAKHHWPAILVLAVLAAAIVGRFAFEIGSGGRAIANFVLTWIPVAMAFGLYAYNKIETFRLGVNRVRFFLTNPTSTWGLTGDLLVHDAEAAWDSALAAVARFEGESARVLASETRRKVWTI